MQTDTIAAIATARGQAALAILRVSGPQAVQVVQACFRGVALAAQPSHTAHFGYILDADATPIDQVVVTLFRAPRSATGEDVVEVSCHGGDFAPRLILERLLHAGARHAAPGEFTQRAFLNGKIDLTQAEAVADLIHASSSLAHRVSLNHVQGRYADLLQQLRDELLELCAYVELELDFAEEDVAFADQDRLLRLLQQADDLLSNLLDSYHVGSLIRDGVRVVIGGRPNAGKSTLLNALLGRDRAIVSPTPGTTRDEIEAEAEIGGFRFRFVDTAGLRDTDDAIEAEGVRRAEASMAAADVLVYVFDLVLGLDPAEADWLRQIQADQPPLALLLVGNKRDLVDQAPMTPVEDLPFFPLSAQRGLHASTPLTALVDHLVETVSRGFSAADASPVVMNQRHRQHLQQARSAVRAALHALAHDASGDTLALDLRVALHELGAITGAITNEDVLGQIFSRFCIGK